MAIENTYLLGKNITLGCGFDLQAKAPLDSRQTVPTFAGLQALIDNNAAYEGMIVYDEGTKKTYQALIIDDVLKFREFGPTVDELKDLISSETTAAMEFKGVATALPENPSKGDFYKVVSDFTITIGDETENVVVGDSIVYDGSTWYVIPSGDDIEDTWRPVTGVDNDSTLTFAAGDKLDKTVAADGTITYKHVEIDAPVNQNSDEDEPTRTYITKLISDNHGHIIGYKTATEVVEDTNTTYTFEGQSDEATSVYFQVKSSDADAAEVIYLDAYSKNEANAELAKKVDVETYNAYIDGKSMSDADLKKHAEDYADSLASNYDVAGAAADVKDELTLEINKKVTAVEGKDLIDTSEIERLATLHNYDDTQVKADIAKKADSETVTAELNKKVDKVTGYSLVSDTEIARLANVNNYDDTAVKADIAKKADAEAMATELGKKVDKVEGHSLVSDTEIARLANVDNYDDEEVRGLILDNANAIGDVQEYVGTFTHDTAKTVVEYIDAKTTSIAASADVEALAGRVTTAEGKIADLETASATHATKTEVEAEFAKYTKTIDLPTDLGDFTNNAGYAKTADVNAELDKKADKTQVATDIANAVAPLAKTEDLNKVKATAEAAAVKADVDAALEARYTKTEADAKFETIDNVALKADKSYVDEELGKKVNTSDYNEDKATFTTKTELKGVSDRVTVVEGILNDAGEGEELTKGLVSRVADLEAIDHDKLAKDASAAAVATVLDGAPEKFDTLKEIAAWIADANTAEDAASLVTRVSALEAIDHDAYVEADTELKEELEGKIDAINDHSHSFVESELNKIADGDVAKWNAEIGAKELAGTKLDASVFTEYSNAHAGDYTNAQIDAAIDADVKVVSDALDAAKSELNTAIEAAKTAASNQDAVVLAEAQSYTDQAKADAIADAESKVNALAGNVYTKAQTYTQEEVNTAISNAVTAALTWGEF